MSTLFTMVDELGKKNVIVLNSKYTKEQLREKLSVPETPYSSGRIEEILSEGIYLPEGETLKIKARKNGTITTQCWGCTWYFYKKYKIEVNPDGSFSRTTPTTTMLKWKLEEMCEDLVNAVKSIFRRELAQ